MNTSLTKNRKQTKGFSLIELLVSMTIVFFLIVGMAQLLCHAISVKRKTDCSLRAAELACHKLEHLRTSSLTGSMAETTQSEELNDVRLNQTFLREWIIHETSPGSKKIEMQCFAINYPRKKIRITLILSSELGF